MSTITLTIEVTEEERAFLIKRFIDTANAVTGEVDEGIPGDPNGDKRDTTGVVWDARFHTAKMTKNQDGTWRRLKNMTDQQKADADAYEAGCRGAPSNVAQAAVGAAPQPVAAPVTEIPAFLQTGTFAPQPTAPVMGMPGMPAALPVAPPAPVPPTYQELIAAFQSTIARVGQPAVDANLATIYANAGVSDMKQLETDENVRLKVKQGLDAL